VCFGLGEGVCGGELLAKIEDRVAVATATP
jgi:hypothetical protein